MRAAPLLLHALDVFLTRDLHGEDLLHHIGFEVESLEAIFDKLAAAGAERRHDVEEALGVGHDHRPNVEVKFRGPDGIMLDVSQTGWVGTSGSGP